VSSSRRERSLLGHPVDLALGKVRVASNLQMKSLSAISGV
jgi:hypothetical protein